MLKVKKVSNKNGGNGNVIIPSKMSTIVGMPKLPLAKIEPTLLNCPNTAALEAVAILKSVKKLSLLRAIARSLPVLFFGGNILFLILVYAVTQDKDKRYVFLWICIRR
tara:strand:+ start:1595 stop:1918 length:324 start_codon:yes stop_codon:yes gene_type:complete